MKNLPPTTLHHPSLRQEGMALFVVLVLVLVLTVLITQLVFVTKVEERISQNRQGHVELSYALQSAARQVLQNLSDDLMEDLGYFEVDDLEGDTLDLGGDGGGIHTTGGGGPGTGLSGGLPGGGAGGGAGGGEGAENSTRIDTRHESWAYPLQDSIDQVQLSGQVIDGEYCIDLNYIFELASLSDESEEDLDEAEELDGEALAAAEAAGIGDLLEDGEEEEDQIKVE